jgi:hypothetical protein
MQLDQRLIFSVRRLITGANVHYLNTLLFLYEQAIKLHNANHPQYRVYDARFEDELRSYVATAARQSA